MNNALFKTQFFPVEGAVKCACIIAGYRGRINGYKKIIKTLNNRGYSVIAYEHSPAVLTGGDPQQLLNLVSQICNDFAKRAADYHEIICIGASIGAGLCFAVQRKVPHVKFGIFAGAGVSPPESIFDVPLFYFVRKKFGKQGFTADELKKAWKDIDILPSKPLSQTPFIMVLGKNDRIVTYDKALTTLHAWQRTGQRIKIITKPGLGHIQIIRWYKKHIDALLVEAESITS
jgi:predicted esterase